MRRIAWQEDVLAGTQNCLPPSKNKSKLPIQNEESLILVMVKVVGGGIASGRRMVN
jgi:hypothetical protein